MPVTDFQAQVLKLLSVNRSPESHLAGGMAMNLEPNQTRYSYDIDYFNDTEAVVAESYAADSETLIANDYAVKTNFSQPGFISATVSKGKSTTLIEWSRDSSWRFLPPVKDDLVGYRLHDIDLAVNKLLALVGRDEVRDLVDTMAVHENLLSIGALAWAAAGKDPGYSPDGIISMLNRKRMPSEQDLARLNLAVSIDPTELKEQFSKALEEAQEFVSSRPSADLGCFYWDSKKQEFVDADLDDPAVSPHFGREFGLLPNAG